MPNDGTTREYNWEDILCLILKDMGLDPNDRQYHDMWYHGGFVEPRHRKDKCITITKYEKDYKERLEENLKDKV